MKIGIIGLGVVGNACKFGFEKNGHNVKVHDIKLNTSISDVLATEIVFICVPTPESRDGSCDTSIVESVISELHSVSYKGHIAIKSTVAPGTTDKLSTLLGTQVSFVPEFLRERCAITDFTEHHDVCMIGTHSDDAYKKIKEAHGRLPDKFVRLTPAEAEFSKYFNNVYNATLVVFANSFYEACKASGVNYANIKNAVVQRKHISDNYLECNDNFRGFGGMCLPKDTAALAKICKDLPVRFFDSLLEENRKYKTTVFDGMRE
tara:strand:+ start:8239 stop:9024 length:786 start_codon:yes stop_codon:yes gene_type:complete